MRSFFWKTIPEEQVRGKTNIWTLAARQQHHYQIDTKTIEELFGQQEDTTKSSLSRRGGTLNSSFRDAREEVRTDRWWRDDPLHAALLYVWKGVYISQVARSLRHKIMQVNVLWK